MLVGCAAPVAGATQPSTPTPTVDPVTQAYLGVLRSSYGYYYAAAQPELDQCYDRLAFYHQTQLLNALPACRPLETAAHDAAQTALAQLATATPPARWQTADANLKQALQAMLPYYAARLRAIDATSAEQFTDAFASIGNQALALFCGPIATFNVGPPKLSPSLPVPYGRICNGGENAGVG